MEAKRTPGTVFRDSQPAPSAPPERPRRRRIGARLALLLPAFALAGLLGQGIAAPARAPSAAANYPEQRSRLRSEITSSKQQDARLAAMASLQQLAQANGDTDTAQLMAVERILATHDDAAIDSSLAALNDVRSRMHVPASAELQEAFARAYGNLYFDAGHFGLALEHQLDALKWAARLPSGRQRATLYRLATIAELYNAMGRPEDALRQADAGLAMTASAPADPGNLVSLLGARALALIQLGRLPEAAKSVEKAEQLGNRKPPDFNTLRTAATRATLELAMDRPDRALQAVKRLQDLAGQQQNEYYRTRATLLQGQARIAAGDIGPGLDEMRAGIAVFERQGQMIDVLDGLEREIRALRAQHAWPETVAALEQRQALWSRLFRSGQALAVAELARQREAAQRQRIAALATQVRLERAQVRAGRLQLALLSVLAMLAVGIAGLLLRSRQRTRRERDRLAHAVRHDPLTGAFSRYEFQSRTDAAASGAADGKALLLLDLDDFKAINDAHGHAAGDVVLKTVVARLQQAMQPGEEIYRWGGEEFLLVLDGRTDASLEQAIETLRHAVIDSPIDWDGRRLAVTLSGGLVRHPLAPGWAATLADGLRWADAAMYAAKHAGRNRVLQVRLTPQGAAALAGHRPIDMAQLLDWQRQGFLALHHGA